MVFDVTLTSQPSWKPEISVCLVAKFVLLV